MGKLIKIIKIGEPIAEILFAGIVILEYVNLRKDINAIYMAVGGWKYR